MADVISNIPENVTLEELEKKIDKSRLPVHVAIIMDGNRRWAKKHGWNPVAGHKQGTETFRNIMIKSRKLGIKYLTVYAFSLENWRRAREEVDFLMNLFISYCRSEKDLMRDNGIRFKLLGRTDGLSKDVINSFTEFAEYTKDGKDMQLNVCINYGSRDEILQAVKKIAQDTNTGRLDPAKIEDEDFSNYLYTAGQPDPDIVIRTSGELRVSNFLLWQIAYSELWFTDVLWPDFSEKHLVQAVLDYQKRDRRFGGTTKK